MSKIIFKKGTTASLAKESLKDGLLSFTTDDGRIHLDYIDETDKQLKRKTLYGGTLHFGKYSFNGTQDVTIDVYEGQIN